jgi:cysteinyl-tRNA synthetase
MSKSLGNVFTVRDILDKGYRASALRYLLISVHYRKQLTFNWDVLAQAEAAVTRLADFLARVEPSRAAMRIQIEAAWLGRGKSSAHVSADLNVPGAQGAIFELVRDMNAAMDQRQVGEADARVIREAFEAFDLVLGVLALRRAEDAKPPVPAEEIDALIDARREARRARNFAKADEIRKDLEARGILLEDSATGTRWKRK